MKNALEFILEDERQRRKETELALNLTTQYNRLEDPFRFKDIEVGDKDKTIYDVNIPGDKGVVITHIANEWYPGIVVKLTIDGVTREYEYESAEINDPKEVNILAREQITWRASNNTGDDDDINNEDREIGVYTDGHFIPIEQYNHLESVTEGSGVETVSEMDR